MTPTFHELLHSFEAAVLRGSGYDVFLAREAVENHVRELEDALDTAEAIADLIENAP